MNSFSIALIVGSFRPLSINRKLARALDVLGKGKFEFTWVRIDDLPFYNQDLEEAPPMEATRVRNEIRAADAVLFVTPEYNRSIPGVLKNAIDWASRPYGKNALSGKPGAVIGASLGKIGTAAAQQHLRTIAASLDIYMMGQPEAYITYVEGLVDDEGKVTDESVKQFLEFFLDSFHSWISRFTAGQ